MAQQAIRKAARKATPAPVVDRKFRQALDLFEKGVKALARRDFDRARDVFDTLLEAHGEHKELAERVQTYRAMCRPRRTSRPKTFEELLNYGVVLHNRGDFAQAVKFLNQAVEIHPRNDSALYCLAAAQARAGDPSAALRSLRSAISANPASRTQARRDDDFEPLRRAHEFQALVAPLDASAR